MTITETTPTPTVPSPTVVIPDAGWPIHPVVPEAPVPAPASLPPVGPPPGQPPVSPWPGYGSQPQPVAVAPTRRRRPWVAVVVVAGILGALLVGVAAALALPSGTSKTHVIADPPLPPRPNPPKVDLPLPAPEIYRQVRPSVVLVETDKALGTGIVLTADGEILTNAHVIAGGSRVTVTVDGDRSPRTATVVAADAGHDLALLRVQGATGLTPATLATTADLPVGSDVVAIGYAKASVLKGDPTLTTGVISAYRQDPDEGKLIQTQAPINHGNSGGPLLDDRGRVIGVTSSVLTGTEDLGFAISVDTVQQVLPRLRAGQSAGASGGGSTSTGPGTTRRPGALGLQLDDGSHGGAVVTGFNGTNGPAARAGVLVGDEITAIGSHRVTGATDLINVIHGMTAGTAVDLTVLRGGRQLHLQATLAAAS